MPDFSEVLLHRIDMILDKLHELANEDRSLEWRFAMIFALNEILKMLNREIDADIY